MEAVEDFIYRHEGQQRELLLQLHQVLTEELNLSPKIRYKIPFYYNRSWICYLNPTKQDTVELAFTRGNELSNAQGLLDSKGRTQVFSVEITSLADIQNEALHEVWQEAILLDETVTYASKRKKG